MIYSLVLCIDSLYTHVQFMKIIYAERLKLSHDSEFL